MLRELAIAALLSIAWSQTFGVQRRSSTSYNNVRIVFDGTCPMSISDYGRVEIWRNNRWNAISDCSSTAFAFGSVDAGDVCTQIGFSSSSGQARSADFYSATSAIRMSAPSDSSANRLFFNSMTCSGSGSNAFCGGCRATFSSSASSTCTGSAWTALGSGSQLSNRDCYASCSGSRLSTTTCSSVSQGNLYSTTINTGGSSCNLGSSSGSSNVGTAVGLIILYIFLSLCCCLLFTGGFYVFLCAGGVLCGIALCGGGSSRQTTAVAVASSASSNNNNANQQTVNVYVPAQTTAQPPVQTYPATQMGAPPTGYGQQAPPQYVQQAPPGYGQPVQYTQPGYPQQQPAYAQPAQAGYAPGYAQPAPGYAPQGGYPAQQY